MMGHLGLYLDKRWAERPLVVMTTMADARHLAEASTAAIATEWTGSMGIATWVEEVVVEWV